MTDHERVLVDKLNNMSNSQQSIQSLSLWVMYHGKKAKESVDIWRKEILNAKSNRKLIYLYLANDIMQNSKKKTTEFVDLFQKILLEVLQTIWNDLSGKDRASVLRMIDIWDQRKIFSTTFCVSLKNTAGSASESLKPPTKHRSHTSQSSTSSSRTSLSSSVLPISKYIQHLEDSLLENEKLDRSYKAATTHHKQEYNQIMAESTKNEQSLGEMSLQQLRKIQNDYDQYLKKYSDLKYALVKENDKRKEYLKALQDELKTQKTLYDQVEETIKEWTSNNVRIQRYLTNIEININNKKLQDDISPVGTHHPSSSGEGGFYFNDEDEDDTSREQYGNKKRFSDNAESSEQDRKRAKLMTDDLLYNGAPPPPPPQQDVNAILGALNSPNRHGDDNFDALMLTSGGTNNAFRLHDDDFNTNQFLYDQD
jgi:regulator of Ty1 transposition protein 103